MARNGYRILDSDLHIMEPPDLWQRYTDAKFKHLAPIGLNDVVRDLRCTHPDGSLWGMPPRPVDSLGQGKTFKRDVARYTYHHNKGWTSEVQLEAMDEEGIDVATLYPTRGLHTLAEPDMDPPLAAALARAYNDWLYEFCQRDPRRLVGVGMISPFNIDDAVAEARRCMTQLGFRGVFLRANIMNGRNWHDKYYDPLWATLVELDVPIGFHESASSAARQVGMQFEPDFLLRHTYSHSVEQMMALGAFTAGGVCERHPKLRAAFLEGNCSWLPWLLWRLDEHWEMFHDVWSRETTMKPSEYFKRQCWVSVDCEETPLKYAIDYLGKSDNIIFSTDFPHVDAQFPNSSNEFLKLPISDEDKRKILWDNCAAFYGTAVAAV
jgi:predicted TIM-barrel fold metal-dependent hydrolase